MSGNAAKARKRTRRVVPAAPHGKRIAARATLVALAIGAFFVWFSPYWAIAGFAQAAKAGHVQSVSEHLNLPLLRESMKGQLRGAGWARRRPFGSPATLVSMFDRSKPAS
jgi:hypothetical protein